jgi:glucose/arabinose dehydrogenase
MGVSAFRSWRWVLLGLPMLALAAGFASDRGAAAPGDDTLFIPVVTVPWAPQISLEPFVTGFENETITDITHAGDERLFVANRQGKVWVVYPNEPDPDERIVEPPFLDVTDSVVHEQNFEQGFLGIAFHPNYPQTPYFYIAYTSEAHIQILRGSVSANNPNLADITSLVTVMSIEKPDAPGGPSPVHNAGDLAFGPDGYLYIPLGDGGPDPYDTPYLPGDPFNNSQRRDTLLGSILRIDPDPTRGLPEDCGMAGMYSIPPDNPWLGDNGCDEIYHIGVRNPWRMSIDPLNGDLYFGDVGEWKFEEVNYLPGNTPGGVNYGWHCYEGTLDYSTVWPQIAGDCDNGQVFTPPVHAYNHSQGECSVIGGKVYRGKLYPAFYGYYFFGDWCSGRLWAMNRVGGAWQVTLAGQQTIQYSTFGEDVNGELYGGAYLSGVLYKVVIK